MAKKFNLWARPEFSLISRRPLKVKPYTDEIGWVANSSSDNPDMRERMIGIDAPAKAIRYMLGLFDRQGGAGVSSIAKSEESYHSSPMIQGTRNFRTFWKGLGHKAGKSKALECVKCKGLLDVNQADLVKDADSPTGWDYIHKSDSYGGCVGAEDNRRRGL
jgi:hypothetical protein